MFDLKIFILKFGNFLLFIFDNYINFLVSRILGKFFFKHIKLDQYHFYNNYPCVKNELLDFDAQKKN